jgi:RimJ/RimL family protein N-acetyltransferase
MITIRESVLKDAGKMAACIDQVAKERKYLASTEGFSKEQTRDFLKMLSDKGGIQLVCQDNDKIVGWCDIVPGSFEGMYHTGHLGMGLLKEYRFQGLGKKMLNQIIQMAFSAKYERIELEVFASNISAVTLYRKCGFQQEGVKRKARKLDNQYDDILVFGLLKNEWEQK